MRTKETIATLRECNNCGYKTLVIHDKDIPCRHCRIGKLEIIAKESVKK